MSKGRGGYPGGGGANMNNMMKQAKRMQQEMERVQAELGTIEVEASAGGGVVKVVAFCDETISSIHINPAAVDPDDVEMLEDTIVAAVNEALKLAKETANQKMGAVTGGLGGLGLPGLGF